MFWVGDGVESLMWG